MTDPILILAAGASSRMRGRDKLLEPVNGAPLLRRTAMTALETGHPVWVVLPPDSARANALHGLDVQRTIAKDAHLGIAHSLRAGVAALPDCERFMLLLADLPDVTADHLRSLFDAASGPVTRAMTGNSPGHPVVFDAALRPEFDRLTGDSGAQAILKRHTVTGIDIGPAATTDLDTPEDWSNWIDIQKDKGRS